MKKLMMHTPLGILWALLGRDLGKLETDPKYQYRFNRVCALLWAVTMVAIPFWPKLYGHATSALIIQEVSLWANFATHFGAMSASLAAINTVAKVADMSDDIDDIHATVVVSPGTFDEALAQDA